MIPQPIDEDNFLLLVPEESNLNWQMHFWLNEGFKNIDPLSAYQACPNKSKEVRRRDKENQAFQHYKHNIEIGTE